MATDRDSTVALARSGAEPHSAEFVYVHASGFCKELWLPVVAEVGRRVEGSEARTMLVDQRGHGGSTPLDGPLLWDLLARDLVRALEDEDLPIVGVGHSSGGSSIARAEILRPGTFSQMILIEPISFPPPFERREIPHATNAERRRRSFATRDQARERFSSGPFARWDPVVLDLYIDHAFHETEEGWTLRCEPSIEAELYREASNVDTWDRLGEISSRVSLLVGERSDSHQDPHLTHLAERFADASVTVLDGLGHLAPMESPGRVGRAISDLLVGEFGSGPAGPSTGTIAE